MIDLVAKVWRRLSLAVGAMLMAVPAVWAAAAETKEAVALAPEVSAVAWKTLWVVLGAMGAIVGSAWATAFAQAKIGPAGAGAMAEKPEVAGTVFIMVAIPETMVVLGFVIAAMIILMVK